MTKSKDSSEGSGPKLAWRGEDPVVFSAVQAALVAEHIPTYEIDEHDQLAFQHVGGPFYNIFVRDEDLPPGAVFVGKPYHPDRLTRQVRELIAAEG